MEYVLLLIGIAAFALNVPLGMWRASLRRFSPGWFVAIHLSVPAIIPLRVAADVPLAAAPVLLALAVGGQVVGSRVARRARAGRPAPEGPGLPTP